MSQDLLRKLLIIEDDHHLAEMLSAYFRVQGYLTLETAWGESGLRLAIDETPDLILLDVHLPDVDGFELCRRLRKSHVTRGIPIIFLTERRARMDKLQGLELGVVDYITKPFDIQELRLRVRNTLQRISRSQAEHPVTGLPEGQQVERQLAALTDPHQAGWSALLITLRGVWEFREEYGFVASDDVLRVVALTVTRAVEEISGDSGFVGHLADDTFIAILSTEQQDALHQRIIERVGHSLHYYYPPADPRRNKQTTDRLGLSIGIISTDDGPFDSVAALKECLYEGQRDVIVQ